MDVIGGMFGTTASAFGNNTWLVIAVIVTAVIMAFGIAGGIERANKFMMPLLFALFLGLEFIFLHFREQAKDTSIFLQLILRDC